MPDGRGARLALEAVFLVAVAAVLVVAHLHPVWIVLAMLLAWVIVALAEWAAWNDEPHWASGYPPRYHVPEQPLPPRPPSVELPIFTTYPRPAARETEAATWIATPEMRAEVLGWPAPDDDEPYVPPVDEPQTTVEELPAELLAEAAVAYEEREEVVGWPVLEPLVEEIDEPGPELELEPEPEPDPEPEPEPEPEPPAPPPAAVEQAPEPEANGDGHRRARHRLDPYAVERRGRFGRRTADGDAIVELPSLPRHAPVPTREPARPGGR
jgi:hypothetical protein